MDAATRLTFDPIAAAEAGTLPGLFLRHGEGTLGRRSYAWHDTCSFAARWQTALAVEHLDPGQRVAMLLRDSVEWVCCGQAALRLGLAMVPPYTTDNPENTAYILDDCGARLLLVGEIGQWRALAPLRARFAKLGRVLCVNPPADASNRTNRELTLVADWLPGSANSLQLQAAGPDCSRHHGLHFRHERAPEGVMLSDCNILSNAEAVLTLVLGYREDLYLSCLPLSHSFRRTVDYCLPIMTGSTVAYAHSVHELPQDLLAIRPTMLSGSLAAPAVAQFVLARLAELLRGFPACARMRGAWLTLKPWTIENGPVTASMKLKRPELERRFAAAIAGLYAGHDAPA